MATIKEVQGACYSVLCICDDICKELNVRLVLQSGTLLGAVRHDGFIPWDDDVDVMMTVKDFRKFKKYFLKHNNEVKGLSISDYQTDHETTICIEKVRCNNSYMPESIGTVGLNVNNGVWIDIFTYCYSARSAKIQTIQQYLRGIVFMLYEKYQNRYKVANGVALDSNKTVQMVYKYAEFVPEAVRKATIGFLQRMISALGSKKSGKYFCICSGITKLNFIDCKIFDDTINHKFGEREFLIPRDYDWYLRTNYGDDYMTPIKYGNHSLIKDVIVNKKENDLS